jgi:hypothetical protein
MPRNASAVDGISETLGSRPSRAFLSTSADSPSSRIAAAVQSTPAQARPEDGAPVGCGRGWSSDQTDPVTLADRACRFRDGVDADAGV